MDEGFKPDQSAPFRPNSGTGPRRIRARRPADAAPLSRLDPRNWAKSRRRRVSWLLASQLALGLLVAITTLMLVLQSRQQALTASRHEMQSLALTLADQAERAFEAVELVQTTFIEMEKAAAIQSPDDFRSLMASPEIRQQLMAHGRTLPQLDTLALIDADGLFINFNHPGPLPGNSVADRPYFRTLKEDPSQTRVISEPVKNRWDGTWAVVVAHRITSSDGRFLGVSFAGVVMRYFEKLYQTVANNEDTAIGLVRNDGVLLARYPAIEGTIGKSVGQGGVITQLAATGTDSEVVMRRSPVDGEERLIAAHTLAGYPLVVAVSSSASAILAPWRRQSAYLIGAAVILELLVFGVGLLMQRQLRSQLLLADARREMEEAETARRLADAARRGAEAELALGQARERADQELRIQAVRFGAALGNMSEVLCLFDATDRLVLGNDRLAAMLGLSAGGIAPGMTIEDMGALLAGSGDQPPTDPQKLHGLITMLRARYTRESRALDMEDGRRIAVNFAPMDNGGWLVTLEDVTEQRRSEARIAHMAHHDALTGLANRVLFHAKLDEAVARSRRGEKYAVLCLDLDHFKAVNDTLGHPTGDALLREVTERLQQVVRKSDTVARLGGDEFAIVQSIEEPVESTALARRLIDAVGAAYQINGNRVIIGTSIGIAIIPQDGEDADEIMKNADMALYRAKLDGRGRYQFFEPEMNARLQARRTLDLDLRKALVEGEFRVFYQPLVKIATRTVCGFEALVRWQHPQRGMVPPIEFIPLAEESGLIIPLGKWILRQACADAARWPGNLKVAVNLSPVQFGSDTLVADVAAALADSGLAPNRLELEITETAMLADTDAVLGILHQLHDLGLRIALDDFGTGYSSLSYLQRFPFNKVKIDRSFVKTLDQGASDSETIVSAVVDLCARLGMITTGEGVETPAQLDRLAALNCVEAQGYLFSRPRPGQDVADMLLKLAPRELAAISG